MLKIIHLKTQHQFTGVIQNMRKINRPRLMPFKSSFEITRIYKTSLSFNARPHSFPISICKKLFANSRLIVIAFFLQSGATNCDGSVMIMKNWFQSILTIVEDHAGKTGVGSSSKRECFTLPPVSCFIGEFFRMTS